MWYVLFGGKFLLTIQSKLWVSSDVCILLFEIPVTTSSKSTPKLYTSTFSVNLPFSMYSGAIYPLQTVNKFQWKLKIRVHQIGKKNKNKSAYSVPAIPVLIWFLSSWKDLANPKSAILAPSLESNKILAAFISLWMILVLLFSWR